MLGFFKKEEQESMTEPLLTSTDDGQFGLTAAQGTIPPDIFGGGNFYIPNGFPRQNGHLPSNGHVQSNGMLPTYDNHGYSNYVDNYVDMLPNDEEVNTSFSTQEPPMFQILYEKFPARVNKTQRRIGKKSQQRLKSDEAQVVLGIEILGVAQVADVQVFVMKVIDPVYHTSEDIIAPQRLVTNITQNNGTYRVSVDLDSVYETEVIDPMGINGNQTKKVKVYKLAKNKTDKANLFNLKVVVVYVDGSRRELETDRSFIIIGKDRKMTQIEEAEEAESNILPAPLTHGKRPRTGTDESISSFESTRDDIRLPAINPQSNISSHSNSSGYNTDYSIEDSVINASKVVAEKIKAKQADIGELIVARPIQVKGGDIAYHFILKDPDAHPDFMEGEVVGLFVNEKGERVLDKLSQKNSVDAILKGVITRSQYIEAQTQPEGVRTETICMFGMVPVRVRGSVTRGHVIYASPDHPGLAVSGSAVGYNLTLKNDAAAIGMAWQTLKCDEDEINLVHCLVSITMEVFHGMIEKKVVHLERKFDTEIETIYKVRKRSRRRKIICSIFLVSFVALLSILLWQLFMPGSAYRYWLCKKGSISGHTSKFKFTPIQSFSRYWAVGYEFTWPALKKRMKDKYSMDLSPINGTGFHYYLNVDRCAYGKTITQTDGMVHKKIVGGPLIFAVDDHCKHAWYYAERWHKWCTYHSAKDLTCTPTHHDHNHDHEPLIDYCT